MPTSTKKYRENVAVVVVNDRGEILACRRCDRFRTWQLPQGGIEPGETAIVALHRELLEEIGTDQVELLAQLDETIRYEWPEHLWDRGFQGQEQTYFLVRLRPEAKVDVAGVPHPEFDATEWLEVEEFLSRISGFRAEAYREALKRFQELLPQVFSKLKK